MGKESKKEMYSYGSKRGYYRIRHTGFYNLNQIIKDLKERLENLGYDIIDKAHEEGLSQAGKETAFEWICSKGVTDYVKFDIELKIMTAHQVEVLVDKKKIQKGDFEFRITSKMTKNHKESFSESKIGEIQRHLYEKVLVKNKLEDSDDHLAEEATELINIVKENLK